MPKIMREQNKKTKIVEDDKEKVMRVTSLIMNRNSVDQILSENFSEYWRKRGAMKATDIVACIGENFDRYCDALDRMVIGKTKRETLKQIYHDRACNKAKQVLRFFRQYCNRTTLMKNLLDEPEIICFPWSVIKDDEIEHPDYIMWRDSVFENDVLDHPDSFYLKSKARVLEWWKEFDTQRSDPESIVKVMVTFYDLFKEDVGRLWDMCNVEHSLDLVEEIYSECFADGKQEQDLKHMEKWILSLGYSQSDMDGIKANLW